MLEVPLYQHEDSGLVQSYRLLGTGNCISYRAIDIRRERTGVHARVSIMVNLVTLAYSTFNVERDEDRTRLANSAFAAWDEDAELDKHEWPKGYMKKGLDLFCDGLWSEQVKSYMGELMEGDPDSPPARRLLGDYVLQDAGTILFAPPGAGKSNTALAWAVSLAWGNNKIWPVHEAAMPLYINVERSRSSMAGRLARINKALGIEGRAAIPFLNARGTSLSDIYEAAQRTIKQEQCTVVFYDSISRAGFGSLIADDVANKTMDMLNALSPSWVALAHSPRADDSHAFGSQMFDAAADLTVQLRSQTSADGFTTGISLQVIKANDIPKGPQTVHVFEWDTDGLKSIRRGIRGEFGELEAGERLSLEEEVARLLLTNGAMSPSDIAESIGRPRQNVQRLLGASSRFVQANREGHKVLYGVKAT